MTAAAMATTATVEAATIMCAFYPAARDRKPSGEWAAVLMSNRSSSRERIDRLREALISATKLSS